MIIKIRDSRWEVKLDSTGLTITNLSHTTKLSTTDPYLIEQAKKLKQIGMR